MATYNIQMKKRNGTGWDILNPFTLASNVTMKNNNNVETEITSLKNPATGTANGLMSAADKKKLDGIANNANNYIHPTGPDYNHVSNTQIANWNDKYTKAEVDTKINQINSGLDWKESVDSFNDIATTYPKPEDGWTVNVKDTDITYRYTGTQWIAVSANAIPIVSQTVDGKMSKEDKKKLDGLVVKVPTIETKVTALESGKADKNHTHAYLPLAGGTATGNITAPTFTGVLKGNASTATTLATARNITVGNITRSFDGSANIVFSLADIGAASGNHTHNNYLQLSGGTMTGAINSTLSTGTFLAGNQGRALIASNATAGSYVTLAKSNSTNGYFTINTFNQSLIVGYTAKTTVDAGTNALTRSLTLLDEFGTSSFPGTVKAPNFSGSLNGNAATATKLQTARTITLTGAINGSATFDGSANITINTNGSGVSGIASSAVTTMGGYTKPTTTGAIATTDSLNTAIGKLEKALDSKANGNHTHQYAGSSSVGGAANTAIKLHTVRTINGTNFDGSANIVTDKWGTARNITIGNTTKQVDGSSNVEWTLAEIGVATSNHTHISNAITAMTGYAKGTSSAAITATDSLNVAIGKLEVGLGTKAAINHGRHIPNACDTITDWNSVVTNGWYMASNATNAPTANTWYFGEVISHNANYVLQTVYAFTKSSDAKLINKFIRAKMNGTWGPWTEVTVAKAVPSNAVFTDTWRGIQNVLTSTSTTESLSAAQGKVLKDLVDGKANANHNQASNTITVMTGYAKGTNSNAIATTDTLNQAIGKLEVGLGTKAPTNHSHNYLPLTGGTINGSLTVAGGGITGSLTGNATTATKLQTARNINLTGGVTGTVSFDGSKDVSMTTTVANVTSDKVTKMTGYSKASSVSAIQQTDSLNVAIGKLEKAIESKSSTTISNVKLTETIVEKTIQANSSSVSIGQTINSNDIVRVYLDGVRLFEGKTYTLTKGANAQITMSTGLSLQSGDVVTFEIVRVTLA